MLLPKYVPRPPPPPPSPQDLAALKAMTFWSGRSLEGCFRTWLLYTRAMAEKEGRADDFYANRARCAAV